MFSTLSTTPGLFSRAIRNWLIGRTQSAEPLHNSSPEPQTPTEHSLGVGMEARLTPEDIGAECPSRAWAGFLFLFY